MQMFPTYLTRSLGYRKTQWNRLLMILGNIQAYNERINKINIRADIRMYTDMDDNLIIKWNDRYKTKLLANDREYISTIDHREGITQVDTIKSIIPIFIHLSKSSYYDNLHIEFYDLIDKVDEFTINIHKIREWCNKIDSFQYILN